MIKVTNIYKFLRLPIWTIRVANMANMNIKGSRDVNWNTNYEIATFVHFSVRCSSFQVMYFMFLIILMN